VASNIAVRGVRLVHTLSAMMHSKEMLQEVQLDMNDKLDKLLVEMEMEEMVQLQQQLAGSMASCSMVMLQYMQLKRMQMMTHVEDSDENNNLALLQMVGRRLKLYDATMCGGMLMEIGGHGQLLVMQHVLQQVQQLLQDSGQEASPEMVEMGQDGQNAAGCIAFDRKERCWWSFSCCSKGSSSMRMSRWCCGAVHAHEHGLMVAHVLTRGSSHDGFELQLAERMLQTCATLYNMYMPRGVAMVMNYLHHLSGIYPSYLDGTYSLESTPHGGAGMDGGWVGAQTADWMSDGMIDDMITETVRGQPRAGVAHSGGGDCAGECAGRTGGTGATVSGCRLRSGGDSATVSGCRLRSGGDSGQTQGDGDADSGTGSQYRLRLVNIASTVEHARLRGGDRTLIAAPDITAYDNSCPARENARSELLWYYGASYPMGSMLPEHAEGDVRR
jgi:hypothetical protein